MSATAQERVVPGRARLATGNFESYEAQLTADELDRLAADLVAGERSIDDIRADAPRWRNGRHAGQPPGVATLEHLREVFRFEQTAAASATAVRALTGVARAVRISDDRLESIGHKILTLVALLRFDAKTFLQLRAARTEIEFERRRLALREREAARDDATHELARQKFQRDTCELFLKWNEDVRAQEIVAAPSDNAAKIEALGRIMFGEDWREPISEVPTAALPVPDPPEAPAISSEPRHFEIQNAPDERCPDGGGAPKNEPVL
jgi:hypothetical protein